MRTQLMCTASQGDRPFNITWRKDDRNLGPAADEWINVSDYAPFSSILTINSVTSSHSGNFTCVVDNQAGTAEYTAHLSVMVPPRWVVEPSDQSVVLGNNIILQCQVDGFPEPSITWKQGIGREPGEYRELDYHGQRIQTMVNGSLIIPHVSEEHEGYFLCQASNGIGPGLSKVIKLTVYAGPRFKVRSRQETARKGELVHLRCEAEGDPPMEIMWKAKGSRIDPGFDIRYLVKVTSLPHGVLSELSIVEASHLDRGEYTCIASNAFGQDHTNIQLLVQEPPIFPRNLQVAEQTSRSIQLTWSPSLGDSPVTSYILQYKEARDVWHEHNPQKVVSGDRTFLIVQGLKPATLYHFRLYAENQLGTSAPSDVLHGITESEVPSGPPLQVNVEPMSSTQLRITWHPPERELWNGDLLGYNIGYRKLGTDKDTYNWTRVAVAGETMGDFRLTGLDKFAQYSIILEAFNTKGDGPPSDQIIAQTLEDVPSAAPMALSCSALTSQNLQVMWHPPPTHLTHGNIQAYKLYYEPTEEWYETDVRETKVTTALTSVLHGLLPFTNYSLQILATTNAGDGVLSPVTYCMTEEAVPEAPERVKAVVVSEDTVVVSWLPPRRPNGLLTKYTVYIRVMEQGQEMKVIKGTLPAQHTHYDAVGLSTKETYEAWVTASNKVGEGPSTMVVTLKPRSIIPAAIVSFGQMLVVAWKVNVKMICLCVGIPRPIAEWKLGDQKLHSQPRMEVTAENTLFIQNVQRNNEGNYSCHVKNNLGSDSIMYSLQVQVPPTAPLLLATTITLNSVQLQWKQGDNGGAAVKGFLLAYRREFGEWEEISVERRATTYLLDGLRCGTRYQFRMAAFNKIGSGSASSLEVARTKGGKPIAPLSARFLKINSTSVHLILSAWQDADCPILYFVVESRRDGPTNENEWRLVSNNILPQQRFPLVDLTPGTRYFLRVAGHNHAGSTLAEYDFTTLSPNTGQPLPDTGVTNLPEEIPFYLDSHVIVPSAVSVSAVVFALAGVCFCLRRKPIQEDLCLHESQTTAVLDNKQNLEQREQYYATVRKPLHSPNRDVSGLERIPEYSEDIYPYATFHLAEQESMASNPQLHSTFGYESRNSDTLLVKQCDTDQYSKVRGTRSRRKSKSFKSESEEYDSLGSDSDTEQGTSSRTESSNHLDDPGSGAGTSRAGVHRPGHHNSLSRTHESSTSTEPSPISEKKHFSRHSKISGNVSIRVNPPVRLTQTEETTFILNHKLNPPCGFSDGLEPSEAECDLDSMKRLRLAINVFAPSSDNQDFTIAV